MTSNKLKIKVKNRQSTWGVTFRSKSLPMVELVAKLGFDYIFLEGEHGVLSLEDIEEICIVADGYGISTVARVPKLDSSTILQFLDRGVMGIRAPHTSTKEEAEAFVRYCKFAPEGVRSFSGSRPAEYQKPKDLQAYMASANNEIMTIAMIEDEEALRNLPEILQIKELDVVTIGPYDLAQSMGEAGPDAPRVLDVIQKAVVQIRNSGKIHERDFMNRIDVMEIFRNGALDYLRKQKVSSAS